MTPAPPDRPIARPTDAPPLAHTAPGQLGATGVSASVPEALVPRDDLPRHVAIIMDGNRRWARAHGVTDFEGHAAGMEATRRLLQHAVRRGIPMLTLYAFSRENWARSDDEVGGLFELLGRAIANETEELREQGVHVQVLGRLDELPDETRASIQGALARTAEGSRLHLNIAWNYAGRTELVDAVRRIVASGVAPEAVDEQTVSEALYTAGLPDPDLLIRTGGERRV
ncbi:MAG TPA: polyprenyl diphosphate synthase, partial [Candidatus Limnocylindrales bacterium]